MSTANTIRFATESTSPSFYLPGISQASTDKVNHLIQENHDNHHIFFNSDGFHNHIAHHLPTLWALRSTPEQLQKHYDNNKSYQRPLTDRPKTTLSVATQLEDPRNWSKFLGKQQYYPDFLQYFQNEITNSSWQEVLQRYLFSRDERADDMLVRLFGGFLHPLIHLGFAIEFTQPALLAEALAQTAVHDAWLHDLLLPTENLASTRRRAHEPATSALDLLTRLRQNPEIISAPQWSDGNKLREGLVRRVPDALADALAQYRLPASPTRRDLQAANAELTQLVAYFTGCAQRPGKVCKLDFFLMHCLNSSVFLPSILGLEFLEAEDKGRLLEWKARVDLALYVSRGSPGLNAGRVKEYVSEEGVRGWGELFERVREIADDGHLAKVVRALAHGERVCAEWEGREEGERWVLKGEDWLRLGNLAVDSVEAGGPTWVRSAGFEEAWKEVPDLESEGEKGKRGSRG